MASVYHLAIVVTILDSSENRGSHIFYTSTNYNGRLQIITIIPKLNKNGKGIVNKNWRN